MQSLDNEIQIYNFGSVAGSMFCDPNLCQNGGKCQYIGVSDGDSEITCLCVDNYVGDVCQYESKWPKNKILVYIQSCHDLLQIYLSWI